MLSEAPYPLALGDIERRIAAHVGEREALQREARRLLDLERQTCIERARELIGTYGLTADELGLAASRARGIRLANPNGPETWCGRGRQPIWVKKALADGQSLELLKHFADLTVARLHSLRAKTEVPARLKNL